MDYIGKRKLAPPPIEEIGPRIMALSKMLRNEFNNAVAEVGLFSGQQIVILALVENEGVTLRELAKMLNVSSATASISIKRMEKTGFVEKRQDEKDARIVRLYPTELARQTPEKIKKHMDDMDRKLKRNMTEEEALELSRLLEKAIHNLKEGCDINA